MSIIGKGSCPENIICWRVFTDNRLFELADRKHSDELIGAIYIDPGFQSVSLVKHKQFEGNIIAKVLVPEGTPCVPSVFVSPYPDETELILQAGSKWKILSFEKQEDKLFLEVMVVE